MFTFCVKRSQTFSKCLTHHLIDDLIPLVLHYESDITLAKVFDWLIDKYPLDLYCAYHYPSNPSLRTKWTISLSKNSNNVQITAECRTAKHKFIVATCSTVATYADLHSVLYNAQTFTYDQMSVRKDFWRQSDDIQRTPVDWSGPLNKRVKDSFNVWASEEAKGAQIPSQTVWQKIPWEFIPFLIYGCCVCLYVATQ